MIKGKTVLKLPLNELQMQLFNMRLQNYAVIPDAAFQSVL